ncbi:MAG: hypothetical protein ACLP9L_26925 [Thermoguttaceae bacterium]
MKKIYALALLLGLGMLVGCGEEPKKTGGSGMSAKPTAAATTTTPPADSAKVK